MMSAIEGTYAVEMALGTLIVAAFGKVPAEAQQACDGRSCREVLMEASG